MASLIILQVVVLGRAFSYNYCRDLPQQGQPEYQYWLKFKDHYGPISSITILGQSMVIIRGKRAAYCLPPKKKKRNRRKRWRASGMKYVVSETFY
ncbi:hypothetical protein F4779DRAFT_601866 [Xylariaceae sp. FL0662B]|nr:hypothetical protein F4779DRAFT_601866 [Xylariaceae sp. FL0662B]